MIDFRSNIGKKEETSTNETVTLPEEKKRFNIYIFKIG